MEGHNKAVLVKVWSCPSLIQHCFGFSLIQWSDELALCKTFAWEIPLPTVPSLPGIKAFPLSSIKLLGKFQFIRVHCCCALIAGVGVGTNVSLSDLSTLASPITMEIRGKWLGQDNVEIALILPKLSTETSTRRKAVIRSTLPQGCICPFLKKKAY